MKKYLQNILLLPLMLIFVQGLSTASAAPIIKNTLDGGYVSAYEKLNMYKNDTEIIKFSNVGVIDWHKTYSSEADNFPSAIIQTIDGGFIVVGSTGSVNAQYAWALKIDQNGLIEWEKKYGYGSADSFSSIIQLSNGDFIAAGSSHNGGDYDGLLIRIASNGALVWQKSFFYNAYQDHFNKIIMINDGNVLVAGTSDYFEVPIYTGIHTGRTFVKFDQNGNVIWSKLYSGYRNADVIQAADGGFLSVGSDSEFGIPSVTKIDANGGYLWQKQFASGTSTVRQLIDNNGIFISGDDYELDGNGYYNYYGYLINLDANGNPGWQKKYLGYTFNSNNAVSMFSDSSFITIGRTDLSNGPIAGIAKLDATGNIFCCTDVAASPSLYEFQVSSTSETGYSYLYEIYDGTLLINVFQASSSVSDSLVFDATLCQGLSVVASPSTLPNIRKGIFSNVLIDGPSLSCNAIPTITISDEYNLYNYNISGFGNSVALEEYKNNKDTDGRHYSITATATDAVGNQATATTEVVVP